MPAEGMNDYLSKPVDLRRLEEVLAKWLPRSPVLDAGETLLGHVQAVFDGEALLRRLMGDRQLAGVVLKGFLRDVPTQLGNLSKRLAEADLPGARMQAHALKGATATVSANALHAIAAKMEQAGGGGQLKHCGELFPAP